MGLFNRLFSKSDDDADHAVRPYKVTYLGKLLGTFTLPVGEHMENPEAQMRRVVTLPFKADMGDEYYLYWVEPDPDGGFRTIHWQPDSPAQEKEAERFYITAHGLRADGTVDSTKQPELAPRGGDENRLIRAARDNRDSAEPYLAYAAWLNAKGDPFGEFIRLSIQIEKLPEDDDNRDRLEDRREDLLEKHGPKWVRSLTELGLFPGESWENEDDFDPGWWAGDRGVIEELEIPAETLVFRADPARLFHAAPFLHGLSVSDTALTVADFTDIPQTEQLENLNLAVGAGTEDDYRRFAESPHFGGLRGLTLSGYGFGPAVAAILAQASWLPGMRELDIGANAVGDDGATAFAASANLANLTALNLSANELTDRGLQALAAAPHLARLKILYLYHNAFTAEGLRALHKAAFAPTLNVLDIAGCCLNAAAVMALAAGAFPALTTLGISRNPAVGDAGVLALIAALFFRQMEVFAANDCDIGNAVAESLRVAPPGPLRVLELSDNHLDDAGIAALMRSPSLATVTRLNLARNSFGAAGVRALAEADLPALEELDLTGVKLGKEGTLALVKSRRLKNLTDLDISESAVGLRGREMIVERFGDDVVTFYN